MIVDPPQSSPIPTSVIYNDNFINFNNLLIIFQFSILSFGLHVKVDGCSLSSRVVVKLFTS